MLAGIGSWNDAPPTEWAKGSCYETISSFSGVVANKCYNVFCTGERDALKSDDTPAGQTLANSLKYTPEHWEGIHPPSSYLL